MSSNPVLAVSPVGPSPVDFGLEVIVDPTVTIVVVSGEADIATAPELGQALLSAIEFAPALLIDFCDCTFMDSSGIQAMVRAQWRASALGVPIEIACAPGSPARMLFNVALPDHYDGHESREAALVALDARGAA